MADMSGNVKLMDYKECEIFVDISGKFHATINGKRVEDRSLSKVKKAIESAEPGVMVFSFSETNVRWPSFSLTKSTILASILHWYTYRADESGTIPGLAEYDKEVEAAMQRIEAQWRADTDVIERRVMAEKQKVLDALPRLTADRLNALIAADRAAKAERK